MDRRTFLSWCGKAAFVAALVSVTGCDTAPEEQTPQTLLDHLRAQNLDVTVVPRLLEGKMATYVTAVNGSPEVPTNNLYWIFFVNGAAVTAPLDETFVSDTDAITFRLMVPYQV